MKIKKGDTVIITTGKDKGKKAKVLQAFPKDSQILVEGINLRKKHQRARKQGQKGSIISVEGRLHVSNAMHIDGKTGKGTRTSPHVKKESKKNAAK